jgi:hypothetical protein
MRAHAIFAVTLLALVVTAKPAGAATDRLAVLPIVLEGEHGGATISSIYDDVAAAAVMRIGVRVISYEEMFAASEEGLGDRVRDCGSDTACVASRLRLFNARLGLVLVLDFSSKPALIRLQLLDTGDSRLVQASVGEVSGGKEEISANIRKRAGELLDAAKYTRAGRVLVDVSPPNARVSLGGLEPDPGTPNRFTVAPGSYTAIAALDGWSSAQGQVTVESGQEAKISLELNEETSILESPWLWAVIGAVAIGTGIGIAVATDKDPKVLCLVQNGVNPDCPE